MKKDLCPYYQSRNTLSAEYHKVDKKIFLEMIRKGISKPKDFCLAKIIAEKNATKIAGHCFKCFRYVVAGKGMGDKLHPGKLNE